MMTYAPPSDDDDDFNSELDSKASTDELAQSPLEDDSDIAEAIEALCREDDAQGVSLLLTRQRQSAGGELTHALRAIEYAIEADAERVFVSLLDLDEQESGSNGLRRRLWGGIQPAHRCAFIGDGELSPDRVAIKCLRAALKRDPLLAFSRDEDGRSVLDWAAMNQRPEGFHLLVESLKIVKAAGLDTPEPMDQLLSSATLCAVSYPENPQHRLMQIDSLSALGFDWREARSEQGQSALTRCLKPSNESANLARLDEMAAALIRAGADLFAPAIKHRERWENVNQPPAPTGVEELDELLRLEFGDALPEAHKNCAETLFDSFKPRRNRPALALEAAIVMLEASYFKQLMESPCENSASFKEKAKDSDRPEAQMAWARYEALLLSETVNTSPQSRQAPKL